MLISVHQSSPTWSLPMKISTSLQPRAWPPQASAHKPDSSSLIYLYIYFRASFFAPHHQPYPHLFGSCQIGSKAHQIQRYSFTLSQTSSVEGGWKKEEAECVIRNLRLHKICASVQQQARKCAAVHTASHHCLHPVRLYLHWSFLLCVQPLLAVDRLIV
uniref:Uncharacterized protein n=1 Tax=Maylandia zebra TaxID=106582 RepID=A0A3P9D218_9CICH